ncbi:unnamed protein product [Meloidogyne enterolobii]|uniref:Uncharacterized protein n=1 Tax=Meloidogyne enterolobii TaxID=390850 RepID=A0ACB1AT43_MELEN
MSVIQKERNLKRIQHMEQHTRTELSQIRERTDYNDIVQYILVIQRLALNENGFENLTIDFNVLERIIVAYIYGK